jgi:hypothetical protein
MLAEADGCWGPVGEDYVTCILEVRASESPPHPVLDARIWLESEGSHVSQAVIMNIAHHQPRMIIQLWEARTRQLRSLRSDRPQQAFKTEEVQVSLIKNVPTASGCLRLSFEKIFERPPHPDTNEGDIIFTTGDLAAIARQVWSRQNLIPREMAKSLEMWDQPYFAKSGARQGAWLGELTTHFCYTDALNSCPKLSAEHNHHNDHELCGPSPNSIL